MFGRKKKKRLQQQAEEERLFYLQSLKNKKIPLLTLDPRWHALFPDYRKTDRIKQLETHLNELIKKQGQTDNDLKEYAKAKRVLMENIVKNMTDGHEQDSPIRAKKQDKNQKLIGEINDKIEEGNLLLERIPAAIKLANQELLIACMQVCYQELTVNTKKIEVLDEWITQVREKLRNAILSKQEMEIRNTEMYTYMHNLLGADVVEIFDRDHQIWRGDISSSRADEEDLEEAERFREREEDSLSEEELEDRKREEERELLERTLQEMDLQEVNKK